MVGVYGLVKCEIMDISHDGPYLFHLLILNSVIPQTNGSRMSSKALKAMKQPMLIRLHPTERVLCYEAIGGYSEWCEVTEAKKVRKTKGTNNHDSC